MVSSFNETAEEYVAEVSEPEELSAPEIEEEIVSAVTNEPVNSEPERSFEPEIEEEQEKPVEIPTEPLFFNPQAEEPIQMPIIEPLEPEQKKSAKKSGGSFFDDLDD
jgi:hypothetical protein